VITTRPPSRAARVATTALTFLAATLLAGCAAVEVPPDVRIQPLTATAAPTTGRSAIVGVHSVIDEKWTKHTVGVLILEIDGVKLPQWQGAIVSAGRHRIVAQYQSIAFRSNPVAIDVDLRPGRKYIVGLEPFNEVTERRVRFRVADLDSDEVIVGRPLSVVPAAPSTPSRTAVLATFRNAMDAALAR
jgi:hypothetical protein